MKWYLKAEKCRMNGGQNILCYMHWCLGRFDHYTGTLILCVTCRKWRHQSFAPVRVRVGSESIWKYIYCIVLLLLYLSALHGRVTEWMIDWLIESRYVQTLLMRNELRVSPRDYFESLVNSIFTELVDLVLTHGAETKQCYMCYMMRVSFS